MLGLSASACLVMNLRPQLDVSHYRGEGAISRIHSAENPGFRIDFGSFSLATDYMSRFRLDGLPRAHGITPYQAVLVANLTGEEDSLWPQVPTDLHRGGLGTLTIKLESKNATTIFEGKIEIAELEWLRFVSDSPFGQARIWEYRPDSNGEVVEQPWFLDVSYHPGADSVERKANIRFMAGGTH
jgi:hypothetical protein